MASNDVVRAGRAALFDLLADLLLHELETPLAERLATDPALAEALQPPTTSEALRGLRAEYADLFLLDLPPYSSVFLDVPPVLGGESALRWERAVSGLGQDVPSSRERAAAPDHAGLVLRALASAERMGRVDLLPAALAWLPQWVTALRRDAQDTFYGRTADLAQAALLASARAAQSHSARAAVGSVFAAPAVPPAPDERNLRTLSRWLCTPAWSGWFLSRRRLRQLAQPFGVGLGIVERDTLLQQVFEASGLDGRTDELLAELCTELSAWQNAWRAWHMALAATPWMDVLALWAAQLAATDALLTQLHDTARTGATG